MEELLRQIFEGQKDIINRLDNMETNMQAEFKNLKEADSDMVNSLKKTNRDFDKIDSLTSDINYLLQRSVRQDKFENSRKMLSDRP